MILDVTAVAVLDNGKPRASGDDPKEYDLDDSPAR